MLRVTFACMSGLIGASLWAAEPAAPAGIDEPMAAAQTVEPIEPAEPAERLTHAPLPTHTATADGDQSPPGQPLDLRIGDVRKYMTPEELQALHASRETEHNTVIVKADAPLLPVKSEQPIPSGMPLLPLWWAVRNPTQAWRIFVPDLNRGPIGPPDSKVPPPEFRWGP